MRALSDRLRGNDAVFVRGTTIARSHDSPCRKRGRPSTALNTRPDIGANTTAEEYSARFQISPQAEAADRRAHREGRKVVPTVLDRYGVPAKQALAAAAVEVPSTP